MISMTEYARRRQILMNQVGPQGIVIIPAAKHFIRNGDAHFYFRQNSDFYYLTGLNEPESVLVLVPHGENGEYILFNRPRDPAMEMWDGERAGQEGAKQNYLADRSFPFSEFKKELPKLLEGREKIYFPIGENAEWDQMIFDCVKKIRARVRSFVNAPQDFVDVAKYVHEMRLLKGDDEIAIMQKAANISCDAHIRAMKMAKPGLFEYELQAEFTHECQRQGALFQAYSSIIGSGKNTCVLHYIDNNKRIEDGDLILIDAGCEYENYASDITRTFPANGRFTAEQKAIYDLVLESQLAAIAAVKPGASWSVMQTAIVKIMTQGLVDLGLLKGEVDGLIERSAYFPFYMHRSGHFLGLDVHDAGQYSKDGQTRSLQAGMVLTIEPGIYITAQTGVPERWHHIGVRIEDDILVTEKGARVLSANCPKTIIEIEALMANS